MQKNETMNEKTAANGSRRSFLQTIGTAGIVLSGAAVGFQTIRSLVPDVLNEPAQRFKIGLPSQLPEGVTFLEDRKLYVFREGKSFHAISAACTHLGCTVKHTQLNQPKEVEIDGQTVTIDAEFLCPCHGSKYYPDGTNYAGPAPRPLRSYKLELSPDDGQLIADMGVEVEQQYRLTV